MGAWVDGLVDGWVGGVEVKPEMENMSSISSIPDTFDVLLLAFYI